MLKRPRFERTVNRNQEKMAIPSAVAFLLLITEIKRARPSMIALSRLPTTIGILTCRYRSAETLYEIPAAIPYPKTMIADVDRRRPR